MFSLSVFRVCSLEERGEVGEKEVVECGGECGVAGVSVDGSVSPSELSEGSSEVLVVD